MFRKAVMKIHRRRKDIPYLRGTAESELYRGLLSAYQVKPHKSHIPSGQDLSFIYIMQGLPIAHAGSDLIVAGASISGGTGNTS